MRGFVVELSNGNIYTEEDISWISLKKHCKNLHLRIVKMHLQFDHQQVFLPNYAKVYFYSKKVTAYLGLSQAQLQHYGVGASIISSDKVTITWYNGKDAHEEVRMVDLEKDSFISCDD